MKPNIRLGANEKQEFWVFTCNYFTPAASKCNMESYGYFSLDKS